MKPNLELVRSVLEAQLEDAVPTRELRDSICIDQAPDPLDMTQQAAAREMAVETLNRESALVRRLRSAIERIDNGSYGVCLQCEEEIAPKRLKGDTVGRVVHPLPGAGRRLGQSKRKWQN